MVKIGLLSGLLIVVFFFVSTVENSSTREKRLTSHTSFVKEPDIGLGSVFFYKHDEGLCRAWFVIEIEDFAKAKSKTTIQRKFENYEVGYVKSVELVSEVYGAVKEWENIPVSSVFNMTERHSITLAELDKLVAEGKIKHHFDCFDSFGRSASKD